jgi:hypothetical protein
MTVPSATRQRQENAMHIQVNTDDNIVGGDTLVERVKAEVVTALERFCDQITRVEVHLSDVNAGKSGSADKRCLIEARPTGRQPIAVSDQAATVEEAVAAAGGKMQRALESAMGKLAARKGSESIRTNSDPAP